MIEIYIGPNGFGKTTKLLEKRKNLISEGIKESEILFLKSEILLSDEVKDTKDESMTMEFILYELLETNAIREIKDKLQNTINETIDANKNKLQLIINEILKFNNGKELKGNFIDKNPKKIQYKNVVTIDKKEFMEKTGSGQRMLLLLNLVKNSSKKYIFLDEPEKYCHPSLLNITSQIINHLVNEGKQVYMSTHSPKLLSMLDISLSNIYIINDSSHQPKSIDLDLILSNAKKSLPMTQYDKKQLKYYEKETCENIIKNIYYKDFLECLFTKKIFLCEGNNDKIFLQKYLQDNNEFYDDYSIMPTFGKFQMPMFLSIFKYLNISVNCIFDEDDEKERKHSQTNEFIQNQSDSYYKFKKFLEKELEYEGEKNDNINFYEYIRNKNFSNSIKFIKKPH